jgi:hypothetical protein
MKKTILLTISFFVLSNLVNAQFGETKQQLFSGSFNLSQAKPNLIFQANKQTFFRNKYRLWSVHFNFKEIAKKLFIGLSIGGNLNIQNNAQENVSNPIKTNTYTATVGIAPVLSYQISNRLVINLQPNTSFADLSYSNSVVKDNTGTLTKNNSVIFNAGFFSSPLTNLSVGFNYLLKHKGK